jgi:4-amino-4-deoxy-L-arabinose transferase-like glycosyltransferase
VKNGRLSSNYLLIISLLIILVGFAIRAHHLAGDSLWIDELLTLNGSDNGLTVMVSQKDHPPLFYAITSLFIRIFGVNEFGARLPSLFAGTIAPALLILLGKLLRRPQAGMWAALLLVLSPFHLRYSQEARHYAVLMALALTTFILLHLALQRPTWQRWLLYALTTLITIYLHYGGFLILASQTLVIAIWLLQRGWASQWQLTKYPLVAASCVLLFYLPWLPRLQLALNRNIGTDIAATNRRYRSLATWASHIFYEFGTDVGLLPYALTGLACIGLLWLLWQHDIYSLGVITAGLLPILLVSVFQVARQPLPRYIIYVFPFYLLAISTAIAALLHLVNQWQQQASFGLTILVVGAVLFIFWPQIQAEYNFVQHDWRGVLQHLSQTAAPTDVLVGMTMDFPYDFNIVVSSFPYYLITTAAPYTFLPSTQVTPRTAASLTTKQANIWGVVMNWGQPMPLDDPSLEITPFQHDIYLVRQTDPGGITTIDRTIDLYQQLMFLANTPSPFCELQRDLANLYTIKQDYDSAHDAVQTAVHECPYLQDSDKAHLLPISRIAYGQLSQHLDAGHTAEARQWAAVILQQLNPNHGVALDTLTAVNLLDQFQAGEITIQENNAPEPVRLERFIMPTTGSAADVILDHPPAAISFPLELPSEPVALSFRMALAPDSWPWGGDGATFIITVQPGGQPPAEIFRQHIGNTFADRTWHVGNVSLADYTGQAVILTLTTEVGPAGNGTGDWAGWGNPRLIWEVPLP